MTYGYLLFHLNLAFSSIEAEARGDVINACYWPLLRFAETLDCVIGIEMTGWTLQQLNRLDPSWVDHFRALLAQKKCELIGSGWTQLIGPLVPYEVNRWNQVLGIQAYEQILGVKPTLVLVNEMAFSTGMVDVYAQAGYTGMVMERNNVRMALGIEHTLITETPTHALGSQNTVLPVLWSDSTLFQRLQRYVHGDITLNDYVSDVKKHVISDQTVLPIYSNDAEVFDYRPGRFASESTMHPEGEWARLIHVCQHLGLTWLSPSEALVQQQVLMMYRPQKLTSWTQPIPVKKQAKYNLNRWAIAGRDNLWINTMCHRIYQVLTENGSDSQHDWQELCELWASDLRTHITAKRWQATLDRLSDVSHRLNLSEYGLQKSVPLVEASVKGVHIEQDSEGIYWTIKTSLVHVVLNVRRGLTIHSLGFRSQQFEPIIGTLSQGYFNTIELSADFYSGGFLMELPGEGVRVTDLNFVQPTVRQQGSSLLLSAVTNTFLGPIEKILTLDLKTEKLSITYDMCAIQRPRGIVRVGILTLIPESWVTPLTLRCVNGGPVSECFEMDREVHYGHAVSTLVSSTTGLGATDGKLQIIDVSGRMLSLTWNPAQCAAVPMLKHRMTSEHPLTRILFSLSEIDDTTRGGGRLLPFTVHITSH